MKLHLLEECDGYCLHPHDGTASLSIALNVLTGIEWITVIIGDNDFGYFVSLNPEDPVEDQIIPDYDWKIIEGYMYKYGGYDGLLQLTQEFYNKAMTQEEKDELHKNDIKKELQLHNEFEKIMCNSSDIIPDEYRSVYYKDDTVMVALCTTKIVYCEHCIFIIDNHPYYVSLNEHEMLSEQSIPERYVPIIDRYLQEEFGTDLIKATQELYNHTMDYIDRVLFQKEDIEQELRYYNICVKRW